MQVAVVGAGPSGTWAAILLARRGHSVVLIDCLGQWVFDRGQQPGGEHYIQVVVSAARALLLRSEASAMPTPSNSPVTSPPAKP